MLHGSSLSAAPASDPDLWLPVTISVAWTLAVRRIRVQPPVLRDVREHVLRCLPDGGDSLEAEFRVPALVEDYLARVQQRRYSRPELPAPPPVPVQRDWVDAIFGGLDALGLAVAHLHYLDGRSCPSIGRHLRIHSSRVHAAREGLRELAAEVAGLRDGPMPGDRERDADRLLKRLVLVPREDCPGPLGLTTDAGLRHADRCPRCSRAVRLIRGGVLAPRDLFRPPGALVAEHHSEVLALLLHPDGRPHRKAVERVLAAHGAVPAGPDAWLVQAERSTELVSALAPLCEEGTPTRHHLRGAVLNGPGRWSRGVLLGPLGVAAVEAARARPWSDLGGLGELPAAKPPPPSAAGWWAAAAACVLATVGFGSATLLPRAPSPDTPVEASFLALDDGWTVRFDTHDLALVDVVALDDGELKIRHRSADAGKGGWSTGEGDFLLDVDADHIAVLSSPEGLADLEAWVLEATRSPDPLDHLSQRVRTADPRADIALSPPRPPSPTAPPTAYTAPAD